MVLLIGVLELFVATLVAWVAILHSALYFRWPVAAIQVVFAIVFTAILAFAAWRLVVTLGGLRRAELRFALQILVSGCAVGALILVASRPDADDVGYLARVLVDTASPSRSLTVEPFMVPFRGKQVEIPFLSENEAYGTMVVVLARTVGIDPLRAYHNPFAAFAAILWVVTYALLFRRFRVPRDTVWLSLAATIVFLLLDGNLHRSFGNFTLLRIWQGKVIVWAVLGPAFLLFTLRYLDRPGLRRFAILPAIAGLGFLLNRSSLFLFVLLGVAIALADALARSSSRRRMARYAPLFAVALVLGLLATVIAVATVSKGQSLWALLGEIYGLSSPVDPASSALRSTWWQSLDQLTIGGPRVLLRNLLFLVAVPLLLPQRRLGRFLGWLGVAVVVLALSPVSGPVWYFFFPKVYWRLIYALPLPLCVGLAVMLLPRTFPRLPAWRRRAAAALTVALVASTGWAIERTVLSAENRVEWKAPSELRLPSDSLAFSRAIGHRLDGKRVLAYEPIAWVLALTHYDSVELVYSRAMCSECPYWPAESGLRECKFSPRSLKAIRMQVDDGVDALIMADCDDAHLAPLRQSIAPVELIEEPDLRSQISRLFWVRRPAVTAQE